MLAWIVSSLVIAVPAQDAVEPLRFNRDVRPILSNHCFECHGPDAAQRKAGLRLDTQDGLAGVVEAGAPERSELARRIRHADPAERMPPASFRHALDEGERAALIRWIEEGADSGTHWAYRRLERVEGDTRAPDGNALDAVDAHLARNMAALEIEPSELADRRTLARRLWLDLWGLPPSPQELAEYLADDGPAAYERLIDRLLSSPHHAERMAQFWLDLVRYADTVGYHGDQEWNAWLYRDWVIRAFAANLPFDQFTIEQLAGDLLAEPTLDQRVASAFNRLNMVTFEGGSQAEEFLVKYAADRVRTLSGAWLGSTVGCAECHDHKFDPFSTRDFYSLAAYFADIEEQGVYTNYQQGAVPPEIAVPNGDQMARLAEIESALESTRGELEREDEQRAAARERWLTTLQASLVGPSSRSDVVWLDDAQPAGAKTQGTWNFQSRLEAPVKSGESARRQAADGLVQHYFNGAARAATPQAGDGFFAWVYLDPEQPPRTIMLQLHSGNWEHRAYWGADEIPFGGPGTEAPQHLRLGDLPPAGEWTRLEVLAQDIGIAPGARVDGMAFTQFAGVAYWDAAGLASSRPALAFDGPPAALLAALENSEDPLHEPAVLAHWRASAPELEPYRAQLAELEQARAQLDSQIPRSLVTNAVEPRPTRILPRGNWMDKSGELVEPATPHFLPAAPGGGDRQTRLDLARWLVAQENPLTARVFVNRVWRLLFGEGLARSVDDVGVQGEWPDHPELLDELALDFVDSGWDVRALVRRLVLTRAYRRSSLPRPDLARLDPENRAFARQNRWRLDAEFVRDVPLAASGLLVRTVGGKSVKPYQPAGYWRELNFPMRTWQQGEGEQLYRRGLYTFWCRTFLHPTLKAFDAPPREECTARRATSNTPQQALALLNDPAFVECARALAERVIAEGGATDAARLEYAYLCALGRPPHAAEQTLLLELLQRQRAQFEDDPAAARSLATVGLAAGSGLDAVEVAAWTSVSRALLNSGEVYSRR